MGMSDALAKACKPEIFFDEPVFPATERSGLPTRVIMGGTDAHESMVSDAVSRHDTVSDLHRP